MTDSPAATVRPGKLRAYAQLMRLPHPIGTWLLMWPGIWSVALACQLYNKAIPWQLLAVIAVGALLMRSAGCIINDLTDADLDAQVARTRTRPIAAGIVSRREAGLLALALVAGSALLILPYGLPTILTAMAALPLVVLYPRMKRITWWPQAFLGLTFNWGAILGWVMVTGTIEWPALLLYAGGIVWTIGYDTIYAHQDREDDALIGVRSTARLFGRHTHIAVALCYMLAVFLWASAISVIPLSISNIIAVIALLAFFMWQIRNMDINNPGACSAMFRANSLAGWLMLLAII